jgi:hypothetical protein
MAGSDSEEPYWELVHQLMIHGWYRVGEGPLDDWGRRHWGFSEGHLSDDGTSPPLWIPASDEYSAMHILLTEVERTLVDRPAPGADPARARTRTSLSDPQTPGGIRENGSRDHRAVSVPS